MERIALGIPGAIVSRYLGKKSGHPDDACCMQVTGCDN